MQWQGSAWNIGPARNDNPPAQALRAGALGGAQHGPAVTKSMRGNSPPNNALNIAMCMYYIEHWYARCLDTVLLGEANGLAQASRTTAARKRGFPCVLAHILELVLVQTQPTTSSYSLGMPDRVQDSNHAYVPESPSWNTCTDMEYHR